MNQYKIRSVVLICVLVLNYGVEIVSGQTRVGIQVPEYQFDDVINAPASTISIADYRGKILILDFWSQYCASCIASFPKIDRLAKRYHDDVSIIAVATSKDKDSRDVCHKIFNAQKIKYDLRIPCAFDAQMFEHFDLPAVGYAVVIGRNGEVLTACLANYLTDSVISRIVDGKPVDLPEAPTNRQVKEELDKILVTIDSASLLDPQSQVANSAVLTNRNDAFAKTNRLIQLEGGGFHLKMFNVPIVNMYRKVVEGKFDNPSFKSVIDRIHVETEKAVFSKDSNYCVEIMSKDLKGHIQSDFIRISLDSLLQVKSAYEKHVKKCLVLTTIDSNLLITKGGIQKSDSKDHLGLQLTNQPMSYLSKVLGNYLGCKLTFIDETHISGNIDIDINLDFRLDKLVRIQEAIKPYGLRLHEEERVIDVLVIRDPLLL